MPELKSVQFGRILNWLRKPVVKRIDMLGGESYFYIKYENEATIMTIGIDGKHYYIDRALWKSVCDRIDSLPVEEASYNLKERVCPERKLEEIYRDMALASKYGVTALRDSLLTDTEIEQYDIRQHIMDDEDERKLHPEIVGNGQIMK